MVEIGEVSPCWSRHGLVAGHAQSADHRSMHTTATTTRYRIPARQEDHLYRLLFCRRIATTIQTAKKAPVTDEFNLLRSDLGLVQVNGCFDGGFYVGDVQVEGSIICVDDLWFQWNPKRYQDIDMDSLALLDIVLPVPELLVLGCGNTIQSVPDELLQSLRERYVSIEALDTKNAVATFNILNQEGRKVVGAFIPLSMSSKTASI